MSIAMLCALGSGLAFALLQIALKQLVRRHRGEAGLLPPYMFPAWVGLLAPVWWLMFYFGHKHGLLVFDLRPEALMWPALWACVMVATQTGFTWLIQRMSLSEVLGYKKGLITLGAMAADVFVFDTLLPVATLLAVGLLLGGAGLLTRNRSRRKLSRPHWSQAAVLMAWCGLVVLQISLYKAGLTHQPEVLAYAVLAQGMAGALFALLWLRRDVRCHFKGGGWLVMLLVCVLAGNLLEGFAYSGLPLAVVLVVTMLPASLLGAYDLLRGDLRPTRAVALGFVCLVLGFVLLVAG